MTITPFPAGNMVGGSIWKIVKDGEEEIVYAIDYNHKKERCGLTMANSSIFLFVVATKVWFCLHSRHLDGAVFDSLSRPHLLITDAYNALSVQARRKERDQALLSEAHSYPSS